LQARKFITRIGRRRKEERNKRKEERERRKEEGGRRKVGSPIIDS
jgi:hypothetical protein